jgi:hypothetical protein
VITYTWRMRHVIDPKKSHADYHNAEKSWYAGTTPPDTTLEDAMQRIVVMNEFIGAHAIGELQSLVRGKQTLDEFMRALSVQPWIKVVAANTFTRTSQ